MTDHLPNKALVCKLVEAVQRLALTRTEAAEAIGVSPRSIDTLLADRTSGFPYLKCGSRVVVPVRELADWLGEQAQKKRGNR